MTAVPRWLERTRELAKVVVHRRLGDTQAMRDMGGRNTLPMQRNNLFSNLSHEHMFARGSDGSALDCCAILDFAQVGIAIHQNPEHQYCGLV